MCWPDKRADGYSSILAYGADALDVLAAAARSSESSGLTLGIAHHAHTALCLLQGQLAAQQLQQLLSTEQQASVSARQAAAVAAEPAAVESRSAVSSAKPAEQQQQQQLDLVLEAALQVVSAVAQVLSSAVFVLAASIA